MRAAGLSFVVLSLAFSAGVSAWAGPASIRKLDVAVAEGRTSLIVTLDDASPYRMFTLSSPDRLVLDIDRARLGASALPLPAGAGVIHQVRVANRPDGSVRMVLELTARAEPQGTMRRAEGPAASQIVVDLRTAPRPSLPAVVSAPAAPTLPAAEPAPVMSRPAPETKSGTVVEPQSVSEQPATMVDARDLDAQRKTASPALPVGRDIVVAIDAGHGGKDPGAHGPRGVREKDVTLKVARRLADVINAEPGMRAVLTRNRDEFIPLRGRMERARTAQADLFLSIHADAVRNRRVQGASVYVLNEKGATDEAARRLAARENAADLIGGVSLGNKDRTLASVLMDLSQNASLSSSIEVGDDVLSELRRVGTVRKSRVMQAPFMVLKSPDVPSLLIETAYISNPDEERRLDSHAYRDRLARAIFSGVRNYFYRNPPRGTLVAEISRGRTESEVQHVIRSGETLSLIATRYNVSVRRIRDANRLSSDRVAVGQVIRIPLVRET